MTGETSPNLDLLLLATVLQLELSERDLRVTDKRYHHLETHLQRPESSVRHLMGTASVYAQGSRAIGATIVHGVADEDRFDLDAVIELAIPPLWTPRKALDELHTSLQGFPDVQEIERCTRCVQLRFAFMHLDVTVMRPGAAPRPERVGEIFHSPDRGADETHWVNPYGFAEWVKARAVPPSVSFHTAANDLRRSLGVADRFVDTIPSLMYAVRAETQNLPAPLDPIRDSWQIIALKLMKRYLNLRYANRSEKRPISVYLSKIAVEVPLNRHGICSQLEGFAVELDRRIAIAVDEGCWPEERNPVYPEENFNDRWPRDVAAMRLFRDDLRHLCGELRRARQSAVAEIQSIFDGLFGERVSAAAIRTYADNLPSVPRKPSYEHGKGFVVAPAVLRPVTEQTTTSRVSRAPAHTFHPRRLKR
ncbi:MAG: nucleotidyltransferase [Pseudomonadota bacterium]